MVEQDVTAVVVTRGDRDITPVLDSLIFPYVVWDNASGKVPDLKTFGRFAACHYAAKSRIIYTQDDDCIVPPEAQAKLLELYDDEQLTVNMPAGHNLGHPRLLLLGWGSVFRRDLPLYAFHRWQAAGYSFDEDGFFETGCDVVFSVLTGGTRHDLGHTDLPYAHAPERSHRQPGYTACKQSYYDRACAL